MKLHKTMRHTREETRERIMRQADRMFRDLGFTKTTVADIAGELRMSPANIYKFFPSKSAIIQAGAERCLAEIEEALLVRAQARQGTALRLQNMGLVIYEYHKALFSREKNIYRLVYTAAEENWPCVQQFKDFLRDKMAGILRDGIREGHLRSTDVTKATQTMLDSMAWIMNPLLFHELKHPEVKSRIERQARLLEMALRARPEAD
jgi:AcrR family transcriptional regulator